MRRPSADESDQQHFKYIKPVRRIVSVIGIVLQPFMQVQRYFMTLPFTHRINRMLGRRGNLSQDRPELHLRSRTLVPATSLLRCPLWMGRHVSGLPSITLRRGDANPASQTAIPSRLDHLLVPAMLATLKMELLTHCDVDRVRPAILPLVEQPSARYVPRDPTLQWQAVGLALSVRQDPYLP